MVTRIRKIMGNELRKTTILKAILDQHFAMIFLGIYVVSQYSQVLNSRFWNLDDHTFALWQINGNKNGLGNFIENLLSTNFGEWGQGMRFTPSLDLSMAARFAIFGTNEAYWFAFNLGLIVATFLGFVLWAKYIGRLLQIHPSFTSQVAISIVGSLLLFNSYSVGVFNRLVVGETYGTAIFFFAFYLSLRIRNTHESLLTRCIFIFLLIVLVGCKENYIFPTLALLYISLDSNKNRIKEKVMIATPVMIATLVVIWGFLPGIVLNKTDAYGQSTEFTRLLEVIPGFFLFPLAQAALILSTLSILLLQKIGLNFWPNIVLILYPLLWMASDFIFYRGVISGHYFQNFIVAASISLLTALYLAISYLRKLAQTNTFHPEVVIVLLLTVLAGAVIPSQRDASNMIGSHVEATQNFQSGIRVVIAAERKDQIVFIAQTSWDYENIISISRYLMENDPSTKAYLYADVNNSDSGSGWATIKQWSRDGIAESIFLSSPTEFGEQKYVCIFSQNMQIDLPTFCKRSITIKWLP